MKVTEHVRGISHFIYFRANNLWYKTDDTGLEFPVPVEDTTGATFDAEHKSMTLMRWIRKHVATINEGGTPVDIAPGDAPASEAPSEDGAPAQLEVILDDITKKRAALSLASMHNQASNYASIDKVTSDLTRVLIERHPELFQPDRFISADDRSFDGKLTTVCLNARWTFEAAQDHSAANDEAMEQKIWADLADQLAAELTSKVADLDEDQAILWYLPATASGIIVDPTTFEPVVVFYSKYAIVPKS